MLSMWPLSKKLLLVVLCISATILIFRFTVDSKDFVSGYLKYVNYVNILPDQNLKQKNSDHLPYYNNSLGGDTQGFITLTAEQSVTSQTDVINDDVVEDDSEKQCVSPRHHVLFLKTHKTGSSTITNILNRFAESNNLTVLLPRQPHSYTFQWPNKFRFSAAAESIVQPHILANHARYSRSAMNVLFPRETTFYVTILRNPVPQFESSFQYFSFADLLGIRKYKDPLRFFLNHSNKEQILLNAKKFPTVNLIRNPLFYDLGLDYKDFDNSTFVKNAVKTIEHDFDLVLLMEHFDESLTLLRRRLCWDVDDVVYFKLNERLKKNRRKQSLSEGEVAKIQEWNSADTALYEFFKKRFWEEVEKEGAEFEADLRNLKTRRKYYAEICIEDEAVEEAYSFVYVKGYKMRGSLRGELKRKCEQMLRNEIKFLDYFRSKKSKWRSRFEDGHIDNFQEDMGSSVYELDEESGDEYTNDTMT